MTAANFKTSLDFVWRPGFDTPRDGYHVTPGDSGGGTKGGVIQASWSNAAREGIVQGALVNATDAQLASVLKHDFWSPACDELPSGIDFLLFNGRMMSGRYCVLFQECLGFSGDDLDGWIGEESIKAAHSKDPMILANALCTRHLAYCQSLSAWKLFGHGWLKRLTAAQSTAQSLITQGHLS